jgi:hypothetical protein
VSTAGRLFALAAEQYWFEGANNTSLLTDGLPYFVQDLWPQGFIGRTLPIRYPELELPDRVQDWNDTHALTYLTRRGEDSVGNLVIGDESLQRYLRSLQDAPAVMATRERVREYPALADAAIAGTITGSSAGGEQPKFTTLLRLGRPDRVVPVLVKFSPAGSDRVSRRWSDLLIAEHVAARTLAAAGLPAAPSSIVVAGGRTFLEVERFDRLGLRGRRGTVTLGAVTNHYVGARNDWITATSRLASMRIIPASDADAIVRIATFGRLIGNVDMHFGNLSFFFSFGGPLELAPVYDMLPMLYAPVAGDELPERRFEVPLPTAENLGIWRQITGLTLQYWREVALHELITKEFADIALRNAAETQRVMDATVLP